MQTLPGSNVVLSALAMACLLSSCATAPKRDESSWNVNRARAWLSKYCSKGPISLSGSVVLQANTREFKGQHPASIRMEKDGSFLLEVTHILGGTLLRLRGRGDSFDIEAPSRPQYNRTGVSRYLGLEVPVLRALLQGELPCPSGAARSAEPETQGPRVRVREGEWDWVYSRTADGGEGVPFAVERVLGKGETPETTARLWIENWDSEGGFARKIRIKTADGELKWIWRSREP